MESATSPPSPHAGWPYEPVEVGAPTAEEIASLPTACLLPSGALREREQQIRSEFLPIVLAREPLDEGYVYWFERTDENYRIVTDFALFESKCCLFLSFGVGLHPGGTKISLRITGPHGREYLDGTVTQDVPLKREVDGRRSD